MNTHERFASELEALRDDPEFLTEELLVALTERIYRRMEALGVRPAELARRLGVSRPAVSQMLSGHANMTLHKLVTIAHALDATVSVELQPRANRLRSPLDYQTPLPLAVEGDPYALLIAA